jgi:HD-GYP domain-containing protein (c-di-GMP phosphodiesterase class II)
MELGINDFVHKPIDHEELALRARWLLELKSAYDRLKGHGQELERAVERRTSALRSALDEMAEAKRFDGTGYPRGICGEEIPIEGRIRAVVDFFDALTTDRPYREALPRAEVIEMMRGRRATHFDPQILDAFLDVAEDIVPEEGVGPA